MTRPRPFPRRCLVRRTEGQNLIEYVLLGSVVALLALGALVPLGTSISGWYEAVAGVARSVGGVEAAGAPTGTDAGEGGGDGSPDGSGKSSCSQTGETSSTGTCR